MARQKKKTCLYCYAPLGGRRDAKTCSPRCRKRLQRARSLLEQDLEQKIGPERLRGRVLAKAGAGGGQL
jgi:hypothetical protein